MKTKYSKRFCLEVEFARNNEPNIFYGIDKKVF